MVRLSSVVCKCTAFSAKEIPRIIIIKCILITNVSWSTLEGSWVETRNSNAENESPFVARPESSNSNSLFDINSHNHHSHHHISTGNNAFPISSTPFRENYIIPDIVSLFCIVNHEIRKCSIVHLIL